MDSAIKTVAVTGATGVVGQHVVRDLLARGVRVKAFTRRLSHHHAKQTHRNLQWIEGNMQDGESLNDLVDSAQAAVHCAFSHEPGRYRGGEGLDPESFWQQNFGGTLNLIAACRKHALRRCVLMSSRAVFGDQLSGWVDDDAATHPDTHYGALKVAEEALAAQYQDQGLRVMCLRATGVFGVQDPIHDSKWWDLVQQVLKTHHTGHPLQLTERTATEVFGGDLAAAVWLLLDSSKANERITYNCSDLVVKRSELISLIHNLAGLPTENRNILWDSVSSEVIKGPSMRCTGLRDLGWKPNGQRAMRETLQRLIEAS